MATAVEYKINMQEKIGIVDTTQIIIDHREKLIPVIGNTEAIVITESKGQIIYLIIQTDHHAYSFCFIGQLVKELVFVTKFGSRYRCTSNKWPIAVLSNYTKWK